MNYQTKIGLRNLLGYHVVSKWNPLDSDYGFTSHNRLIERILRVGYIADTLTDRDERAEGQVDSGQLHLLVAEIKANRIINTVLMELKCSPLSLGLDVVCRSIKR